MPHSRPNLIFADFLKTAASMAASPMKSTGPDGAGDSMQKLKSTPTPRYTAPNPTQATPNPNPPIAGQKITPPPPVQ